MSTNQQGKSMRKQFISLISFAQIMQFFLNIKLKGGFNPAPPPCVRLCVMEYSSWQILTRYFPHSTVHTLLRTLQPSQQIL